MDWNPDEVRNAIELELIGEEGEPLPSVEGVAEDKLTKAAPIAAEAMVRLLLYSENESMRYKASAYVLDRVFGKITEEGLSSAGIKSTLEQFAGIVTASYEEGGDDGSTD